jgi:iron complex transport system ATP-binding protein
MSALLSATDIHFAYNDRPTLRGISVSLSPGQVISLIGPNGSGKSTLIKALLGHLPATGNILWNNKPLSQWRRRDIAKIVAYLPQSPAHDPGQTVLDVLRLGRAPYWGAFGIESSSDESVVNQVSAQLQLTDLLHRPMDHLSGGQRQRVFIGRCLAQQPQALLLDEPSTYLDLKHQLDLYTLLKNLSRQQNLAIMLASHELNLAAAFSDQLMLLNDGAAVASGPPTQVLTPEVLEPVFGVKLQRIELSQGVAAVLPIPMIQ